ncbi:MAG: CBM35 domain-containing protein [Acidimicrobiales bacterium]
MSRDAQQPRGADRPRGAFDIPDDELGSSSRPGSHGLFDPTGEVRAADGQTGSDPFDLPTLEQSAVKAPRRDTGRVLGAPILGSGPEIARSPRREPTGRHEALRLAPFAPTAAAPAVKPSALERIVDAVQRWRSPLGLGLAALITIGVVVVYERSTGSDQIATDASGGEGRSAFASATDFDETDDEIAVESTSGPQQDVDSAVDEITPSTADTESGNGPNTGSSTTTGPASPTTAGTPDDAASPTTPTTPATPSSAGSPAPTTRPTAPTDPQTSSPSSSAPASAPSIPTPPTTATPPASSTTTAPPDPPAPVRTEAEAAAVLGGASVATERSGFSGTGYVTGLDSAGDGVSFTVTSAGGETPFAIGYSAGPVDGAPALRTASILVDGDRKTSAQMDETPTFDDWTIVAGTLDLPAGQSTITIEVQAGESGQINIDYVEVG